MSRLLLFLLCCTALSCQRSGPTADAYGNFEAEELIVSAETSGLLLAFTVEEGQSLHRGVQVGRIDSVQLQLKRDQLQASIRALVAKSPAIGSQLAVYEGQTASIRQQMATLEHEKRRVENLLKSDAATPKQLDDLNAQIEAAQRQMDVIGQQKSATNANLSTQKSGLLAEALPLQKQIAQIDDQLQKCIITNPVAGTVLTTYAKAGEVTAFGKPLYKIANLDTLILRAYLAGDQLGNAKIGQTVTVSIDAPEGKTRDFQGRITWISAKAEFTPKVIQTKDERVNLVYPIKITVANPDGVLKIGMPGEMRLGDRSQETGVSGKESGVRK